jgi:hypothetical protein
MSMTRRSVMVSNLIRLAVVFLAAAAGFAILAASDGAAGVTYWVASVPYAAAVLAPGALLSFVAVAVLRAETTRGIVLRAAACGVVTAVPAVVMVNRLLTTVDRGPNAGPFDPTPLVVIVGVFAGLVGVGFGWVALPRRTNTKLTPR